MKALVEIAKIKIKKLWHTGNRPSQCLVEPRFLTSVFLCAALFIASVCHAFETEASYYTRASCLREGTSGIMANGERLSDEALVCASWDYGFGTKLLITNKRNGRQVVVSVTDRGPSKRLYRKGRKIDLSFSAFKAIENPARGVAQITVKRIRG